MPKKKTSKKQKPLKVGFDLDGVLLYNPARVVRPIVKRFKRKFLPKRVETFYIPKTKPEQIFWNFLHLSSIFPAPGWHEIEELVKEGKIEAYVVTARFGFMKPDIDRWMKVFNKGHIFKDIIYNKHNKQPHVHKEEIAKKLGLDVFVEDNWDIVKHLTEETDTKTFWVYNLFDKQIDYDRKTPGLGKAITEIKKMLKNH